MSRMLAIGLITALSFAVRTSFAVGGSVGGRGYTSSAIGGVNSTGDSPSSLHHNYGGQVGGVGSGNQTVTPRINAASTDNNSLTTGPKGFTGGAKGYPKTGTGGSIHVTKNLQGVSGTSDTPGGRGF